MSSCLMNADLDPRSIKPRQNSETWIYIPSSAFVHNEYFGKVRRELRTEL